VMLALGDAFRFGPLTTYYHLYNPLGVVGALGGVLTAYQLFEALSILGGMLLSAGCIASLLALVLRLQRARAEERRQLRWFSYAAVPALIGSVLILLDWTAERFALLFFGKAFWPVLWVAENIGVFVRNPRMAERLADLRLDTIFDLLTTSAFLAVSVGTAVAILEHRLYAQELLATRAVRGAVTATSTLSWLRILSVGTVVGFSPVVFNLVVYAYVDFHPTLVGDESGSEQLAEAAAFASGWATRVFFILTTILAAWWVAKWTRGRTTLHGALIGLVAAIVNQINLLYPYNFVASSFYRPVTLSDLSIYVVLGIAGGWLGGAAGRTTLDGDVYRVTRSISEANDPDDVAAAIGEHLGGADVHDVTLWRVASHTVGTDGAAGKYACLGSWTPNEEEAWSPDAHLGEGELQSLVRLDGQTPMMLQSADLPAAERATWERQDIRSALLMPLLAPGDVRVGLLSATFRRRRRFSKGLVRAYLTVGTQAALALENMRLVEEARRAGREAGLLDERQRLAREIHDTLAQGFTGIVTNLKAAQMSRSQAPSDATSARYLEDAERIAHESLAETRRLVWALRPESLDRRSLSESLHRLAEKWSEDTSAQACAVTTGTPRPLLPETEVALIRAAQEALTNVRKHARASRVNITLSYMDERVALDVLDDGVGFDLTWLTSSLEPHGTGGFGLKAMRERIEQLGGTLVVESAPGEGTALAVELPVITARPEARGADTGEPQTPEVDR
jgi:signal transduction histidine kinase